ncbi:MAG: response regulator [Deltaproteobacteria bacterium]|nr:response regulator [Deltaproteobacteria bacterium]
MTSILIVEDDHDTRVALRHMLEEAGYFVASAGHGAAALMMLDSITKPTLIVADVNMPIMNGNQLIEALKTHPDWKSIPVIQISAADSEPSPGAFAHAKKPIDAESFLRMIASSIGVD